MEEQALGMMTVLAHPDDEAFGASGSARRAIASGKRAAYVCATRGEAGEIADPALATRDNLGQVREQELRNSAAAVGVTDVTFLDYIDGHLPEADHDEAVGRIVAQLRHFRPDVVITFASNGMYGHIDHIAIHHLTNDAVLAAADPAKYPEAGTPHRVRKLYYQTVSREKFLALQQAMPAQDGQDSVPGGDQATIPLEAMGSAASDITTSVTLDDAEYADKARAMVAHATQMPADGPMNQGTDEQRRMFMGFEDFILVPPPYSDREYPTPETDLFDNL